MNNSRRHALKVMAAATISTLPLMAGAEGKKKKAGDAGGDAGLPLVKAGEGMAAGVKYVEKSTDATKTCANCVLYTAAGKKDGKDVGKCSIFQGQLVLADAYCASWSKKA